MYKRQVNPYVALAARGPWIITLKGAVVHDSGGYGMLGLGHTPKAVLEAMAKPQVMANIMTPNIAQLKFDRAMRKEIGQTIGGSPYTHFMCLNSGSESVSLASRIVDANAKTMTDPGARHAGRSIKRLVVKGAFHGRTDKPALYSDSTRKTYIQHLASYRGENTVITVTPYDIDALRKVFADADANGWFIEAMFMEPVMGEGDPGRSVPRDFYDAARELTTAHGALLLVDSIQAGLRATGYLSIVDYPGFEAVSYTHLDVYKRQVQHRVALGLGFADREAADRIAIETDVLQPLRRAAAQVAMHPALHDAEQRRVVAFVRALAALGPAQAELHRTRDHAYIDRLAIDMHRRTFVEDHDLSLIHI